MLWHCQVQSHGLFVVSLVIPFIPNTVVKNSLSSFFSFSFSSSYFCIVLLMSPFYHLVNCLAQITKETPKSLDQCIKPHLRTARVLLRAPLPGHLSHFIAYLYGFQIFLTFFFHLWMFCLCIYLSTVHAVTLETSKEHRITWNWN